MAGVLRSLGLIGDALSPTRYLAGEGFLDAIMFLGCSPRIELSPRPDSPADSFDFCHVQVPPSLASPELHAGRNLKAPRCPRCRKPFAGKDDIRKASVHPEVPRPCAACGSRSAPIALNWRRSACIARFVVNIQDIHESEAVPSPGFLGGIEAATGTAWAYCYITD